MALKAMRDEIFKRIREIKDELGADLYTDYRAFRDRANLDRVISNGNGYFFLSEKYNNGYCYTGYRCSKYGDILKNAHAECVDVADVLLAIADDEDEDYYEYEHIGYVIDENRTVIYTMEGKWNEHCQWVFVL